MKEGEKKGGGVEGRGGDGLENEGGNLPHCDGRIRVLHLFMDFHQELKKMFFPIHNYR